jgi:hypothetical protein
MVGKYNKTPRKYKSGRKNATLAPNSSNGLIFSLHMDNIFFSFPLQFSSKM